MTDIRQLVDNEAIAQRTWPVTGSEVRNGSEDRSGSEVTELDEKASARGAPGFGCDGAELTGEETDFPGLLRHNLGPENAAKHCTNKKVDT